jgi:serine/threonine protein kinase
MSKLIVSPQTIPEGRRVEHSLDSLGSPREEITSPLSRNSSTRSTRIPGSRPARIPLGERTRRSSRRSTSANTSISPAQAFLSSWTREDLVAEPARTVRPDDEGETFGVQGSEYVIGRTINQGGFGVIKEARTIIAGHEVIHAVKIVRKTCVDNGDNSPAEVEKVQQDFDHEISIWRELDHRHILKMHASYETDYAIFCVMDLNVGGTLFDLVRQARTSAASNAGRRGLEPKLAKAYAFQLACALRYLHEDMKICHRDVKLENCLIDMTGPDVATEGGLLRLCDFGLADFLYGEGSRDDVSPERTPSAAESGNPTTSSVIGTLEYASPKGLSVNRKLYETAGDVWAFGVIVYALCTGDLPFRHVMPSRTMQLILQADWDVMALKNAAAGGDAVIELVRGCLEKEIESRLGIGEVLGCEWFEGCQEGPGREEVGREGVW